VIFHRSIGRTDLPGGDLPTLLNSIRTQILTLPPQTRLLSGHGLETSVGEEKSQNPYL
jgi:glyoxylase-like metal-dependent hydrolase (beta-lactamase superfamily II)